MPPVPKSKPRPPSTPEEALGDRDFEAALLEALSGDPIARLGFDLRRTFPEELMEKGHFGDFRKDLDRMRFDPRQGQEAPGTIAHEARHRGINILNALGADLPRMANRQSESFIRMFDAISPLEESREQADLYFGGEDVIDENLQIAQDELKQAILAAQTELRLRNPMRPIGAAELERPEEVEPGILDTILKALGLDPGGLRRNPF